MSSTLREITENAHAHNCKRLKIKQHIDEIPSGAEFTVTSISKKFNLTIPNAKGHIQQHRDEQQRTDVESIGKGIWRKL